MRSQHLREFQQELSTQTPIRRSTPIAPQGEPVHQQTWDQSERHSGAILRLQQTIGNQAVVQRLRSNTIQRVYSQDGTDPTTQTAAVASRTGANDPTQRFCVGVVTIFYRVNGATRSVVQSQSTVSQHAEKRGLDRAMAGALVDGFDESKPGVTAKALTQAGITNIDIYTEFPLVKIANRFYVR